MSLPEQLVVLQDAVQRLERAAIPYMLTGSVAMNYYGEPRMTRDIDLVVEMDEAAIPRFLRAFENDFHLSEPALAAAVRDQGLFSSIHIGQVVKLDFVIRKHSVYRQQEFARRQPANLGGIQVFLVTPEDLILSKLEWCKQSESELQLRDVRNLIDSSPELDWNYINRWAGELTVTALLKRLR